MAAKKIRVFELARELGMTNKEVLDLCDALGIGVKSHSSGIIEAQADRARRRAERDGLTRDVQPEEPQKPARATRAKPVAEPEQASVFAPSAATSSVAPTSARRQRSQPEPADVESPEVTEAPAPEVADTPPAAESPAAPPEAAPEPAAAEAEPTPASEAEVPSAPTATEDAPAAPRPPAEESRRTISSKDRARQARAEDLARPATPPPTPRPATPPAARGPVGPNAPRPGGPGAAPGARPPASAGPGAPRGGRPGAPGSAPAAAGPPMSRTGKPIPPPPGPPVSRAGNPIPPPPGLGGRGPSPQRPGGRPGGPGGPGGPRGPRPGGPGGPGRTGPPVGGPGGFPPPGNAPGGGRGRPGGPGGPGGPRGPQQRRKSRRRRNREELQPMDAPSYTPQDAPVPDGVVVIERLSTPQVMGPKLNRTAADVVRFLMQQGEMVMATQSLSDDMIELFAAEIGAEIHLVDPGEEQEVELVKSLAIPEDDEDYQSLPERPPVITVMGHVDHGKTKLLDRIRNANVVAGEAGGITQHIGAYQTEHNGRKITFLDTPGHEAFTSMRARGADATDLVILVVAADDGVMPTTVEAVQHAKAAEVPIMVAINKIDRENADPTRVRQQLSELDLVPEEWGGDTVVVEISALQGLGIDELLENVLLIADVEDLRANEDGRATGVVLESHLDVGRGPVATVLVQRGTLRVGDPLVAGPSWGRVRALINDNGEQVKEAGPSAPVEVLGLSDVAASGDSFVVAPDEKRAKSVAETRGRWQRDIQRSRDASALASGAKLEDIFEQIQRGEQASLNVVVKADVHGSLEAVTESLKKLERDEVKISFVLRGVGGITKSDIQLAATANATIIGFNVRPDRAARELAEEEGVEIRTYEIIYKLLEDIETAMVGMLAPEFEEVVTGEAEVREVFRLPKVGAVAGCYVTSGVITRNSKVRFLRDGAIIWKGELASLRRFKDDVKEVAAGFECGVALSDFQDLKQGDVIETYDLREIPRT